MRVSGVTDAGAIISCGPHRQRARRGHRGRASCATAKQVKVAPARPAAATREARHEEHFRVGDPPPGDPVVLFVVLLLHGPGRASSACRVTLNPDISFPGVQVLVSQPGASPQEIETQIMQKVEGAVAGIGNIDSITSLAIEGQSRVFIEFAIGTPIDRAVADVRDAVAKVRVDLPQGIQEPVVARMDVDGNQVAFFAVSSSALSDEELSWFVDNTISKRLLGVEGVSQVSRGGGVSREIRIELDPARMQALGRHRRAGEPAAALAEPRLPRRPRPGGRRRAGDPRARRGAQRARPRATRRSCCPAGASPACRTSPPSRTAWARSARWRASNGRPATTFSILKAKGTSDVTVMNGRGRGTRQDPQGKPERHDRPDLHDRRPTPTPPITRR